MPEFKENEINRQKKKMEDLAPYIEKAMKRKKEFKQLQDKEIPKVVALGRQVTEQSESQSDSSVFDDNNFAAE
jgi:predicted RNase H-like nuclease